MRETNRTLVADHLLSRQPASIKRRLEANEEFLHSVGLDYDHMLGTAGVSIPLGRLLSSARQVLHDGGEQQVEVLGEGSVVLRCGDSGPVLTLPPKETSHEPTSILFRELRLLSPQVDERLAALERVVRFLGPLAGDLTPVQEIVRERPLSDDEMASILTDLWKGPQAVQERIAQRLRTGGATVEDLAPRDLAYFEAFCGPDPGDLDPEVYLRSILPEYRQTLISRDLRQGLRICLLGALRDDLCPGIWLGGIDDQDLWDALVSCEPEREVFSLLGALDVSLYRQHDERFRTFAADAVQRLTEDTLKRPDDVDCYDLLPLLSDFFLSWLNLLEGGPQRMPTWKRMCAWMQSSLIAQLTYVIGLELPRLETALAQGQGIAARYASILDLAREPMYKAVEAARSTLRAEVVGRLLQMKQRHNREGRDLPREDDIQSAVTRLNQTAPLFSYFMPGPLEGHRRPGSGERSMPDEIRQALPEVIERGTLASFLAYLSQLFPLDGESRSTFLKWLKERSKEAGIAPTAVLTDLGYAGLVAGAERDEEIAEAIASSIGTLAPTLRSEATVAAGLRALLIAGAAYEEQARRSEWLERRLSEYAALLPMGEAGVALLAHIQEVEKVAGLKGRFLRRAKAVAIAGH